jgi:hypothetical protein
MSSENPSGADNQQETGNGILRDCTPGPSISSVKVQSDPHGDMRSQAEMTWPRQQACDGVTSMPKVAKFLVG